jgi:hypothetical protein
VVPAIQRAVANDIDSLLDTLMSTTARLWAEADWLRYDDKEINCSIQLYRWSDEAKRRSSEFGLLSIQLEWGASYT